MTSKHVNPTQSISLVLIGMLILSVIDNTVPLVSGDISLWQFHFMRGVWSLVLLFGFMWVRNIKLTALRWWAVLVRCGLLSLSMVVYFGAVGVLSVPEAVAGLFAAPIIVVVITALFLPEPVGWVRWLAAIVGFVGTLLVLSPETEGFSILNLIPLIAALFYAMGALATRELCEGETTISMLFVYVAMMGVIGFFGVLWTTFVAPGGTGYLDRGWANPSTLTWGVLFVQGIGSQIGVACLIRAYAVGEASYVAVYEYSMLIFASVVAYIMFGHIIGWYAVLGMALIIGAGIVIAVRSQAAGEM
ncbi:MAG: DMT family transporter [Planktomarina sp.]